VHFTGHRLIALALATGSLFNLFRGFFAAVAFVRPVGCPVLNARNVPSETGGLDESMPKIERLPIPDAALCGSVSALLGKLAHLH
jgi:hypothetical protein